MSQHALTLTDANFDAQVIQAAHPTVVNFWAPWCTPFHATLPVLDQLAREFDGRAAIGKLNVSEHTDTALKYDVRSIPTLIIFHGGKVIRRDVGMFEREELTTTITTTIEAIVP